MRLYWVFIILAVVALVTAAPVTARYVSPEGSNAGINPGDTVFNGERGINFSAFQLSPPLKPPLWMACDDGGSALALQTLDSSAVMAGRVNVESGYLDRPFKLYNGSWGDAICTVSRPAGTIEVRTGTELGTDADPSMTDTRTPAVIPATINIQFKLDATNLNNGNFVKPWYEYELRTPGGIPISTVTNMDGDTVSLTGLTGDPSADNNTLAFSIADQNTNPEEGTYVMEFTAYNGNDAFYTVDYPFDVVRYTLSSSVSPPVVQEDQTTTLTIVGKPFTHYTIVIEDAMEGKPEIQPSGKYDIYVDKYNATVHPDWSGTVSVPLYLPVTSGDSSQTTRSYYPKVYETGNPSTYTTAQISVEPGGQAQDIVIYENKLAGDEYYSLGDSITISGTLGAPAKADMEMYFYLMGVNTDSNGVKPSSPSVSVVDDDDSTFDVLRISKDQKEFSYNWHTEKTGLTPGTYTIFATLKPLGYNSRPLSEKEIKDFISFDLNEPSINVKFPEEAPGFFAQGDHIVSIWTARGSPAKTSFNGRIRYYIFGKNYEYTGFREFPLPKVADDASGQQLSVLAETHGFPGYSSLDLPRVFSENMSPGEYIVLYQHPMNNQKFDLVPSQGDEYKGTITTLVTTNGPSIDVASLQTTDAVSAIKSALDSPRIDDTFVTQTFVIEKPLLKIDPILDFIVGEQISVTGTTNLECPIEYQYNQINLPGDMISFSVYAADMYYAGKTQSTNRIYSDETYPKKTKKGATSRDISFTIPVEISQKMKPGDYVARVRCEDIKYEKTVLFTLHEEGYSKERVVVSPRTGEEFSPDAAPSATPVKTIAAPERQRTPQVPVVDETTSAPEQAAGFEAKFHVLLAILILCTLVCARRR